MDGSFWPTYKRAALTLLQSLGRQLQHVQATQDSKEQDGMVWRRTWMTNGEVSYLCRPGAAGDLYSECIALLTTQVNDPTFFAVPDSANAFTFFGAYESEHGLIWLRVRFYDCPLLPRPRRFQPGALDNKAILA